MKRGRLWALLVVTALGAGCVENAIWLLAGAAGRFDRTDAPLEFPALNFRYLHPGRPWFEELQKPRDTAVALMRLNPEVHVLAWAWEDEDGSRNSDDIARDLVAELGKNRDASVQAPTSVTLAGKDARRMSVRLTVEKRRMVQEHIVLGHNGYGYHLSVASPEEDADEMRALLPELLARFRQADPDRVSSRVKGVPFKGYASRLSPYKLEWNQRPWRAWPDLAKDAPEAETGALSPDGDGGFVVGAMNFSGERPRHEALAAALLSMMNAKVADEGVRAVSEPVAAGPDQLQQEWTFSRTGDKESWFYRGMLQMFPHHAVMTWAWSRKNLATAEAYLRLVTAGLKSTSAPEPGEASEDAVTAQAHLNNRVGLFFFEARQYQQACPWFTTALQKSPRTTVMLRNATHCLFFARQHREAVALVEAAGQEQARDNAVQSWLAWNLDALGESGRAMEILKQLLANGHTDDEDLEKTADLLEAAGRSQDALAAWDGYLALHGSAALYERYSRYLYRHKHHATAADMLQKRLANQFQPSLVYARLTHLSALERHKEVIEATDDLIARGYESAECYAWRGRAEYRLKWYRKAKVSLEKALAKDPSDKEIVEWLDGVNAMLGEGTNSNVKETLQPVPLPDTLQRELVVPGPDANGTALATSYLWRVDAIAYERNVVERSTLYRRVRIRDDAGVSRFSTLTFGFNSDAERIFVNRLVVLDAQGNEVAQGNVDDSYVLHKPGDTASNDVVLHVPVPRLQRGHDLEFVVTRETRGAASRLSMRSIPMAASYDAGLIAVYFRGDPKDVRLQHQQVPAPVPAAGGILVAHRNVRGLREEPWSPDVNVYGPLVRLGDARAQWKTLAQEYLARIQPALSDDAGVSQLARDLTRGATTPDARVAALLDHIHQRVTYRAIEFGTRGTVPVAGARTLQQGYGDCKDHSVLLLQLLHAVGIPAHLALIHTSVPLDPQLPSLDQFNHMIVYLPRQGRFVDPTDRYMDPAIAVPGGLSGRHALILDDKGTLQRVPEYAREDLQVTVERSVTVEPQGSLRVDETTTWRSYYAGHMRSFLLEKDTAGRNGFIQDVVQREAPGSTVTKTTITGLEEYRAPLQVRVSYSTPLPSQQEGGTLPLQLPVTWERYYLSMPAVPERATPFQVAFPFLLQARTRLIANGKTTLRGDDQKPFQRNNPTGSCRVSFGKEGKDGIVDARCLWVPGVHSAALWKEHEDMGRQSVQAMQSGWKQRTEQ